MVDLGDAATYAVLSGASVGNTVSAPGAPHTTLRGHLGVKANAQPTGFPPGVVTGAVRVGTPAAVAAHDDLVSAYAEVAARPGGAPLAGALAGTTVPPGLHTVAGAVSNTTTVTLDAAGDPDAVFVFQIDGAMAMAAGSSVVLTGGARASRVFWQVGGAGAVGANARFAGTLMALDAVAVGNGTIVNGRAFARNGALTLDANEVYGTPPVVTIQGGAEAITTDTTPTLTGETDVTGTDAVRVTVGGQSLRATPSGGTWTVTSDLLPNGDHPVTASVTDGAGNVATAEQRLRVDTVLPVVSITGGASVLTNDPTPTISGVSDVATDSRVRVRVAGQSLVAVVHEGGAWNVTPVSLVDGTHTVSATVTDPAGNAGVAAQTLEVDTVAPVLTIGGGSAALTNDPTPTITGTIAAPAGTSVAVVLADEDLASVVDADGAWSVTARDLTDGPHRVVVSGDDPAGNRSRTVQTLTVDTVAPQVTIGGGTAARTSNVAPTITGASDAAPGTTVTVSIGGQTMTTLLQDNGTWNATPSAVGAGTWTVVASAPDPAGNVGVAHQTLTISGAGPPAPGPGPGTEGPDGAGTPPPGAPSAPGGPGGTPAPGVTPPEVVLPPQGPGVTVPLAMTPAGRATVSRTARQRLRGTALSVATTVRASTAGRVAIRVSGLVRVAGVRRSVPLTTRSTSIAAGSSAKPALRLRGTKTATRATFRRLRIAARRGKRVTATIVVRITDADGRVRVVRRSVRLTA